jgi:glyoxylase-like metal-dependent hydrolase (beta-lactamase superfamily II)
MREGKQMTKIKNVHVVSTGTVDIHPRHAYRSRAPTMWWILTSKEWLTGLPINVFIIEHQDGLVLFDTGQDRASVTDPDYFPGGPLRILYDRLARFEIGPHDTLPKKLKAIGYSIEHVTHAVISHLHQDHIGGLRHLQHATIVTSRTEHDQLESRFAEVNGVLRRHIDLPGLSWKPIDFEPLADQELKPFEWGFDLMGDRTMVVLPTPGHTPGSLSMLVRHGDTASLLMVGDLTYDAAAMERDHIVPGVGSVRQLQESTNRVLALKRRHPHLQILGAHDPAAARLLVEAEVTDHRLAHPKDESR